MQSDHGLPVKYGRTRIARRQSQIVKDMEAIVFAKRSQHSSNLSQWIRRSCELTEVYGVAHR